MWLDLATARLPSGEERDHAVRVREALTAHMTPTQIAEAQRLAREWDAAHPASAR
jgi:hypothetical protein